MGVSDHVKTEKSLSQEPIVVITHLINFSTYDCIVFFLQNEFISLCR